MSTSHTAPGAARSRTAAFRHLADGRKRRLLGVVARGEPVSTRDLATRLAASEGNADDALVTLRHAVVPALVDAGLVREDGDALALADHPALADDAITSLALDPARAGDESLDALFDALADPRRRAALSVLADASGPTSTTALARAVAAREDGRRPQTVPADRVEAVRVSLIHAHLPRLADADLVTYDPDASVVAYDGHPDLREQWLDAGARTGPV